MARPNYARGYRSRAIQRLDRGGDVRHERQDRIGLLALPTVAELVANLPGEYVGMRAVHLHDSLDERHEALLVVLVEESVLQHDNPARLFVRVVEAGRVTP